jgi:ribosomal protein S18 acetylase RimI-like enzyme
MEVTMKIESKIATLDDANIIGEVFDLYRIFYNQVSDVSIAQQYITERLKNNESTIFFVEENSICLGFTQLYPTFDSVNVRKKIVLYDLFVREAYRRRGIAESLMNAAKEYATQNNFGSIELSTNKTNLPGQTLYESLGYIRDNEFYSYDLEI